MNLCLPCSYLSVLWFLFDLDNWMISTHLNESVLYRLEIISTLLSLIFNCMKESMHAPVCVQIFLSVKLTENCVLVNETEHSPATFASVEALKVIISSAA